MAMVDGQLRCVYNLGDREAELQVEQTLTRSETQEAVMDRVKFQRYLRPQTSIARVAEPHF